MEWHICHNTCCYHFEIYTLALDYLHTHHFGTFLVVKGERIRHKKESVRRMLSLETIKKLHSPTDSAE